MRREGNLTPSLISPARGEMRREGDLTPHSHLSRKGRDEKGRRPPGIKTGEPLTKKN
jgi:hypothetical protein